MAITSKQRKDAESIFYQVLDTVDKTKTNSEYYKKIFAKLSNDQFEQFWKNRFPFRFHVKPFEIQPTVEEITSALNIIKVPLMEEVNMPYLFEEGEEPVRSAECLVGYIPLKKVKQFITKKNSMSVDISQRDMKTGLLTGYDKNGKTSDRELESLAVMGLHDTMTEFSRPKADSMRAKNIMYNVINTLGQVSQEDIPIDQDDSLSKNLMNTYLIGSHLKSNLIDQDYYLVYTLRNRQKTLKRE